MVFIDNNFVIPEPLQTEQFHFVILEPSVAEQDYEAVMSSKYRLRNLFAEKDRWPEDDMTLEYNIQDLSRHEVEFKSREAFAYAVLSSCKVNYLGCVYIFPSTVVDYDCEVYLWIRESVLEFDHELYHSVKSWLQNKWPFECVAFPGREIAWSDWNGDRHW